MVADSRRSEIVDARLRGALARATISYLAPELSRPQGLALGQRDRGRHDDCNGKDPACLVIRDHTRACGHDAFGRPQMKSVQRYSSVKREAEEDWAAEVGGTKIPAAVVNPGTRCVLRRDRQRGAKARVGLNVQIGLFASMLFP